MADKVTITFHDGHFTITSEQGNEELERQIGDAFARAIAAMLEAQTGEPAVYEMRPDEQFPAFPFVS